MKLRKKSAVKIFASLSPVWACEAVCENRQGEPCLTHCFHYVRFQALGRNFANPSSVYSPLRLLRKMTELARRGLIGHLLIISMDYP